MDHDTIEELEAEVATLQSQNEALQEGVSLGLKFIKGDYDTPSFDEVVEQLANLLTPTQER
jgi:hypothetical protein